MPSLPNTHPDPLSSGALTLVSERLLMRPLALDDLDLALEMFTDPEVMEFISEVMSADEIEQEMPTYLRRGAGGRIGVWCVLLRETGEKIGTAALLPLPIEEDDTHWALLEDHRYPDAEIEVGYYLKRSAWGRGYATETCTRMLQFAFEQTDLAEVVAVTDHRNTVSQSVLKKSGMTHLGTRRAYRWDETPSFRQTREEWLTRQRP
ncbi:MAG: GNAT family N-acetyltransferase [Pseudomonadota bacterium]